MNPAPLVFLVTFFALATSWLSFVLVPQLQIGGQQQAAIEEGGAPIYPPKLPGLARQGEDVYRANGCFYCHTEQVRPRGFGSDVARHWGGRLGPVQNVAEDYLYAQPAMLGSVRIGPDLANIGLRQTNEVWLLQHLYNPQSLAPGSTMPPYRFLFEKRQLKPGQKPSAEALPPDPNFPGYEILPKTDAKALVAYLLNLHSDAVLFEAPGLEVNKAAPAAKSTNGPAGAAPAATNSPAK